MYRVVIVDDEPLIVEGLSRSFEWKRWGCAVIGTAGDGNEGLKVIQREHPDILITDISMPGQNGLVMIAGMKSEFPDTRIMILTGYRDFDYAREAIRLGVDRFLLKPSRMEELEEAMDYMTDSLKKSGIVPESEEAGSFIVKNALEYIEMHYREKIRLNDVANQVFVSQWHLSKLLNRHTGKSFSDILNGIRIEHARQLLAVPSMRVCDVAEAVGFIDLAHFSRVFKSQEGQSANEYRNSLK